jgi:hypothetical protein
MLQQAEPGLVSGKIDRHRFVVAVSQVPQPAEQVAEMDQGYAGSEGVFATWW